MIFGDWDGEDDLAFDYRSHLIQFPRSDLAIKTAAKPRGRVIGGLETFDDSEEQRIINGRMLVICGHDWSRQRPIVTMKT